MVNGSDWLPSHPEPHKFHRSMKTHQKYAMWPRSVILAISKSPLPSTTAPQLTVTFLLTLSTYANYFSERCLTIAGSEIRVPTPATHMHPTTMWLLIQNDTLWLMQLILSSDYYTSVTYSDSYSASNQWHWSIPKRIDRDGRSINCIFIIDKCTIPALHSCLRWISEYTKHWHRWRWSFTCPGRNQSNKWDL
jgi:hypothetical protein